MRRRVYDVPQRVAAWRVPTSHRAYVVTETPSGLPDEEDEVTPLGVPADDEDGRDGDGDELPGFPEDEPDTAG
jgi:hypothetical protein